MGTLSLDVKIGETVRIGNDYIKVTDKGGRRVKLVVTSSQDVKVLREQPLPANESGRMSASQSPTRTEE